jgi:hypothetical protein
MSARGTGRKSAGACRKKNQTATFMVHRGSHPGTSTRKAWQFIEYSGVL